MEPDLLILNPGSTTALAGGNFNIIGTTGGDETVVLAPAGGLDLDVVFDPSFNGGDNVITFDGDIEDYTIVRSGSSVVISGNGTTATIPVGIEANSIVFTNGDDADTELDLVFNTTDNEIQIGGVTVDTTESPITGAPNAAPVAEDDTATVTEGQSFTGSVATNDSDPNGDTLTYSLKDPVDGLTLNADGSFTFDATTGFDDLDEGETATVQADVIVSDGEFNDFSTLTITVQGGDPGLSVDNPTVTEGAGNATFTITLDSPSVGQTFVNFTTVNGTAVANQDFTPVSGTITFQDGQTSATVSVPILNDTNVEQDEVFTLRANIQGEVTADGQATILNDDAVTTTLTTEVDNFEGSDDPEIFISENNGSITLNPGDFIDGAGGMDSLNIRADGGSFSGFQVQNVETIQITNNDNDGDFNFSSVVGVDTIRFLNTTANTEVNNAEAANVALVNVTNSPDIAVDYTPGAVAGSSTAVTVTGNNVAVNSLSVGDSGAGVESLTLVANGPVSIDALGSSDVASLTVTGAGNVSIANDFGANTKTVDGSGATGALTFTFNNGDDSTVTTYVGSSGVDTVTVGSDNRIDGDFGAGDDDVTVGRDLDFDGTDGNADDVLDGGAGDDTLTITDAQDDDDSFSGVSNFETLVIDTGDSDTSLGANAAAAGFTTISLVGDSGFQDDGFFDGDVTVVVGTGNNTFTTGEGDDTIDATNGSINTSDVIDAGDGDDTLLVSGDADITNVDGVETVNLTAPGGAALTLDTDETDVAAQVINAATGTGLFELAGGAATADLDVTSTSTNGNETIVTGSGDDVIRQGDGTNPGVGNGPAAFGGDGDDAILGGAGNNNISGDDGDDVLSGAEGSDSVSGGNGNDVLFGGSGDDELFGDDGNDILHGGAGEDELTGGAGADTFFFLEQSESSTDNITEITDFDVTEDNINVSGLQDAVAQGLEINLLDGDTDDATSIAFDNGTLATGAFTANDGLLDVAYDGQFLYFDINDDGAFENDDDLVIEVGALANSADIDVGDGDTVDADAGLDLVNGAVDMTPFTLAEINA